jgi:scyllo-inositol 2-dehydrogenase (NADP+)
MTAPINVGIVGYGYAGRSFHSYLLKFAKGLKLYAVATRDPERRAQAEKEQGVKTFVSLEEMLRDDNVQLVVLATPHDVHCEQTVAALNAGRHVITDKVMCLTLKEFDRMAAAAKKNRRMLSVFQNRRWDGDFQTVQRVIKDGLLGHPSWIEVAVHRWQPKGPRTWRGTMQSSGGILYDWGAHMTDQALLLTGAKPVQVYCIGQRMRDLHEVETTARMEIRFAPRHGHGKDGIVYAIELSNMSLIDKPHWFVVGTEGTLLKNGLDPQEQFMVRGEIENSKEDRTNYARVKSTRRGGREIKVPTIPGDWRSYYQNVADHLLRGAKLQVTTDQIRPQIAILEAAYKSQRTGKPVQL